MTFFTVYHSDGEGFKFRLFGSEGNQVLESDWQPDLGTAQSDVNELMAAMVIPLAEEPARTMRAQAKRAKRKARP